MQEHRDSDLFCFGDGWVCGIFPPPLRFVWKRSDLPLFLLHIRTAFFEAHLLSTFEVLHYCILLHVLQCVAVEAHLLSPLKIWQICALKSYKVFMEPPYTSVTPWCIRIYSLVHIITYKTYITIHIRKRTQNVSVYLVPLYIRIYIRVHVRVTHIYRILDLL